MIKLWKITKLISKWAAIFAFALMLIMALAWLIGLRFNKTNSIPYGIYKTVNKKVVRNSFVRFCPPDTEAFRIGRERNYIPVGFCPHGYMELMKEVIGIPGDTYQFTEQGLILNGILIPNTKPIKEDISHRPMPLNKAKGFLENDEYILMGLEIPNSYDARYYGVIRKENITGSLEPLLIMKD